ncbi:MAG: hypothetical protein RIG77_12910 [Cyclobacteriaceae bacterium]
MALVVSMTCDTKSLMSFESNMAHLDETDNSNSHHHTGDAGHDNHVHSDDNQDRHAQESEQGCCLEFSIKLFSLLIKHTQKDIVLDTVDLPIEQLSPAKFLSFVGSHVDIKVAQNSLPPPFIRDIAVFIQSFLI